MTDRIIVDLSRTMNGKVEALEKHMEWFDDTKENAMLHHLRCYWNEMKQTEKMKEVYQKLREYKLIKYFNWYSQGSCTVQARLRYTKRYKKQLSRMLYEFRTVFGKPKIERELPRKYCLRINRYYENRLIRITVDYKISKEGWKEMFKPSPNKKCVAEKVVQDTRYKDTRYVYNCKI